MINTLLAQMLTRLGFAFNGAGMPVIVEGPVKPPAGQLPRIVLSAGKLEIPPPFGDTPPGEMRPRQGMDHFLINTPNASMGPYTLGQTPLEGTVFCRFNWLERGGLEEGKKQQIYPRKDQMSDGFEINYKTRQMKIFFSSPLSGNPTLEVEYNYPAIFTLCEFKQIIILESYAGTPGDAEKWAALATAVLTTNARTLLDGANDIINRHIAGDYATRSLYNTFHLSEGLPERSADSVFRYSLYFNVTGQLILERTYTDPVNIIRNIFSPGHKKTDTSSIDIEANLG